MRWLFPFLLLIAAATLERGPAAAQEAVTFLQSRPPGEGMPITLRGTLYRPAGEGPFPAMVMLHGCAGVEANSQIWGDLLVKAGYVALDVDSLGPRGLRTICVSLSVPARERTRDAYGALAYLSRLPFVHASRIGTMGFSHGGATSLFSVLRDTVELYPRPHPRFRVAAPFYPVCWDFSPTGFFVQGRPISAPVLILMGDRDRTTPAHPCRILVEEATARGETAFIKVYPGAGHAFDHTDVATRGRARADLLAFLSAHL
jgi:dienelactone hydrolase